MTLRGTNSDDQALTFRVDSSKIYKVKELNGTVTYSMRLIPSTGDSRREFYNLYYKKDSTGKVAQLIIKFKPTTASIKSNYAFFEGEHEVISTDPVNQGLIKSNNISGKNKRNNIEMQCVEIAFDYPCSYNNVHPENGPGWWCLGAGSYSIVIKDCWAVGSSSSMTSFTSALNYSNSNNSGAVIVTSNTLSNIVLCEDPERDNFILSLYESYKGWINNSSNNLNTFNQLVSSICGDLSEENKNFIISTIEYLKSVNGNLEEKVDESVDSDVYDPNAKIDTSLYNKYDSSMIWPTIPSLVSPKKFIGWMYPGVRKNCFDYAKKQVEIFGYSPGALNSSSHIQVYSTSGVNLSKTKDAVGYLIYALNKGIPVVVGVDDQAGASNTDQVTDHFIVIVGSGTDINGKYFLFFDNAANFMNSSAGTSNQNRLYFDEQTGIIKGKSQTNYAQASGRHDYIVTQVRKSVK